MAPSTMNGGFVRCDPVRHQYPRPKIRVGGCSLQAPQNTGDELRNWLRVPCQCCLKASKLIGLTQCMRSGLIRLLPDGDGLQ